MPVAFVRVSLLGSLPGGEVWSVNPAYGGDFATTPPTAAQLQTWADAVSGMGDDLVPAALQQLMSNAASLDSVKIAAYNDDGTLSSYVESPLANAIVGTSTISAPPTTALALSLYTATVGRSGRGRIFWPALGLSLDTTTGRVPLATCASIASAAEEMLSAIENAGPAAFDPFLAVYSQRLGSRQPVTQIKVGDVPDSQRGRKNALAEQRAIVNYPAP